MGTQYGTASASSSTGGKTLTQLKAICKYHGWNDFTDNGTAALTQFINDTLQLLATLAEWPEYLGRNGSVTFPARTVSIVSISESAGTVTLITGTHGYAAGDIITITSTDNYDEASVAIATVADTTHIAYVSSNTGATSTGTVTIDNNVETLSDTRLSRTGIVARSDRAAPLTEITLEEWLFLKKNQASVGPPLQYAFRKYMSSGAPKTEMMVYPDPTASVTLYYTYRVYPAILTNPGDVAEWPDTRVWLLTDALRIRLAEVDRDSGGAALYGMDFMKKVRRAVGHARPSYMPIIAKPIFGVGGKPAWSLKHVEVNIVS